MLRCCWPLTLKLPVSKLLGQASIAVTSNVYGHLIGTVASDAVNVRLT